MSRRLMQSILGLERINKIVYMKTVIKIVIGVFQHLNGVEVTRVIMELRV